MKKLLSAVGLAVSVFGFLLSCHTSPAVKNEETVLIVDKGYETVKENCTVCHSAKLIIQNRMDRQGWLETIRWMQNTQGLRQFDAETESIILDYLSTHYAPLKTYRRPPLKVEWE